MPFSIIIGVLAGKVATSVFTKVWGQIIDEEPPDAKHREIPYAQLVGALILEGAILKLVRGFVDHGLRHAWMRSTGEWPGDERPQPE